MSKKAADKSRQNRKPTDSELAILGVIWEGGSATVREVFDQLSAQAGKSGIGYTTVLKFMQIMTEKGLLERDTSVRPQVFRAAKPQKQTQKMMLKHLVDGAFSGSPGNLVLQALSMKKASAEELQEIRDLLDSIEEERS